MLVLWPRSPATKVRGRCVRNLVSRLGPVSTYSLSQLTALVLASMVAGGAAAADFVRPEKAGDPLRWGMVGGLQIGLWQASRRDGPRGLIRLFYPVDGPQQAASLVNFIAVEPVVEGRKGYSELERSPGDGQQGLRMAAIQQPLMATTRDPAPPSAGELGTLTDQPGVSTLSVPIAVEPFANGAHVGLVATFRSDRPGEVQFAVHAEQDSARLEYATLSATMGNYARLRRLWLRTRVVDSKVVYADYQGTDFTSDVYFPRDDLLVTREGDVLVAATPDEAHPAAVRPFAGRSNWWWHGGVFTQYWRKPAGASKPDLHVRVNGRRTYWGFGQLIPGGVSFENSELRERYYPGQVFVWGITPETPLALGFPNFDAPPP